MPVIAGRPAIVIKQKHFDVFCDVYHQCQAMPELYVGPLWYGEQPNAIAIASYLFKYKFKALTTL